MRAEDLNRETFRLGDLTFAQLCTLTPKDPDWRDAEFLVFNGDWNPQKDEKRIVIVCGKSRVIDGERVHCVGYSNCETAWLRLEAIADLKLRDFSVLPKMR